MDTGFGSAETTGHVFINLYDNMFCGLAHSTQMGSTWPEVKVAVLVHGGYLKHCHIIRAVKIAVVSRELGITDWCIERTAAADQFSLIAAHMPGVPGKVLTGILPFKYGKRL